MNLLLPGVGLIYLGRRRADVVLASLFLLCFAIAVGWFLLAYMRYFELAFSDDLMKEGTLERMETIFPTTGLVILAAIGVIVHLVSMALYRSAAREEGLKGTAA